MSGLLKPSEGMKKTLLWTNPKPTTAVGTSTLSGSGAAGAGLNTMLDYDYILVVFRHKSGVENCVAITEIIDGNNFFLALGGSQGSSVSRPLYNSGSATTIKIGQGTNGNNGYDIPTAIYGIKGKIR